MRRGNDVTDDLREARAGEATDDTHVAIADDLVDDLRQRLLAWYAENGRDLPWRRTRDPYAILVSEVMLQQTQVPRVVPKYAAFLERFPDLDTLAEVPLADVLSVWSGLGYNNRAVRLKKAAEAAVARSRDGRLPTLPDTVEELMRLPGIGPYTARAVLIFAHNADLAAVDANIRRVLLHELRLPHDLPAADLQQVAEVVLPRGRARDWHNALMDYGALVLTSRATGIAPLTTQSPFEGSRRSYRSRLVRLLLAESPRRRQALPDLLGLPYEDANEIVRLLEADELVVCDDELVRLA